MKRVNDDAKTALAAAIVVSAKKTQESLEANDGSSKYLAEVTKALSIAYAAVSKGLTGTVSA